VSNIGRNAAIWCLLALLLIAAFNMFNSPVQKIDVELSYNELLDTANKHELDEVLLKGNVVTGKLKGGKVFSSYLPTQAQGLPDRLVEKGVRVKVGPAEEISPSFFQVLLSWFPILLLIGAWIFLMRHMQGGGGKAMSFGKSKAKLLSEKSGSVTFDDVAGIDEAKAELEEIVDFLKDPQKFQRLGGKIPKGVLLVGPPGTGKTLLARAIAGEAKVPFFTISGSDFVEMFVGVGASRVRDMFEQGKKNAPCIIFIDEIDAVGRHRGAGLGGGNDEREQTLNQLLVEMDGFESNEGVILIAATNRPDVLDPALLRPGRFDRQVVVPNPDIAGREKILTVHMRKVPLNDDVEVKSLARGTPGFSGADLANLVNEAALMAARRGKRAVGMSEFEEAKDKVIMGSERRSIAMTDQEKRLTAYHEAGHALVASLCPQSDPIHKATIIPRGRALGMVVRLPEGDRVSLSREKLLADLAVAYGGRIAEELFFGVDKVTTGASSDIKMATGLARRMVTEWGLSDVMGPVAYGDNSQEVFLGHSVTQQKSVSERTAEQIDAQVRVILDEAYDRSAKLIKDNKKKLEAIAEHLLEYETLSGEEISQLMAGKKLHKEVGASAAPVRRRSSVPSADEGEQTPIVPHKKETKVKKAAVGKVAQKASSKAAPKKAVKKPAGKAPKKA
jgi:cell division protease FtsH